MSKMKCVSSRRLLSQIAAQAIHDQSNEASAEADEKVQANPQFVDSSPAKDSSCRLSPLRLGRYSQSLVH